MFEAEYFFVAICFNVGEYELYLVNKENAELVKESLERQVSFGFIAHDSMDLTKEKYVWVKYDRLETVRIWPEEGQEVEQ